MKTPARIGLIGLDTSHATVFTELLNDSGNKHHVPGGRVVAAFPGGSPDFEKSASRVEEYTATLRDKFDVKMLDSPAAVAECVDYVFIESVDGRVHLEQFKETAPYKRPTFIDKPMTHSAADAIEMFRLAEEGGFPLMSTSPARYFEAYQTALLNARKGGRAVRSCDVIGPLEFEETQPGMYWYGVHLVDMLFAAMGTGCRQVRSFVSGNVYLITGVWHDGRVGMIRGNQGMSTCYGAALYCEKHTEIVDIRTGKRPPAVGLLQNIFDRFTDGKASRLWEATEASSLNPDAAAGVFGVPADETREVMRFLDASNRSIETGEIVDIES